MKEIYVGNCTELLRTSAEPSFAFLHGPSPALQKKALKKLLTALVRPVAVFFILCALVISQKAVAQTASLYNFSTVSNGSLASDLNSNVIDMTTGTTLLIGANQNDAATAVTPIGFSFTFMSSVYTQFSASSNGVVRLGTTPISSTSYGNAFPIPSASIVAPYMQDLQTSSTGKVHYKLFGAYPNRTLVVEFLNMSINNGGADGTFQVRLYEQTNVMEYVYGAMNVGSTSGSASSQIAAIGFSNTNGANSELSVDQNTYATTTLAAPITNTNSSTGTITGLNSTADGSRRVFRFTPTLPYKSQFLSLATGASSWCPGETRTVTVTVKNIGTATWTNASPDVNIGVKWNADPTYLVKVDANGLTPGSTQTYSLTVTAPATPATNNLTFDVINETSGALATNTGAVGPGNLAYLSPTINISGAPVFITQPATASQTVCINGTLTTLTVTATGATSFQWYSNTTAANTGGTLLTGATGLTYTPLSTTAGTLYYYCVASGATCPSSSTVSGARIVNAAPVANAITGASTVCIGSTTTLNPNATGTAPLTYTWSSSATGVATITNAGVATGVATGSTNITYVVKDANTCTATSPVYALAVTKPTAAAITGANKTCVGSTVTLTSAGSGVAPLTYTWASSSTAVATVSNTGVVTGVGSGSTNITYTVTDANGCTTTSAAFSFTINQPTATAITGATKVCVGSTTTLVNHGGGGTTPLTYTWASSNTAVATVTNAGIVTGVAAGTVNITYTVTDANSCTATSPAYPFTVNAIPVANAMTGPSGMCIGSTITMVPNATGSGTLVYAWVSSATSIATINSSGVATGKAAGSANLSYSVTDGNGCVSASSPAYPVTVAAVPTAGAITQATSLHSVCVNSTLALTSNGTGSGPLTYVWSSSNTAVATVDNTGLVTGVSAGSTNITYVVINNGVCSSASSAAYAVTVILIPTGSLTATEASGTANNDNTICTGATVTFTATSGYPSYTFKVNGVVTQPASATNIFSSNSLADGSVVTVDVANSANCGTTFNPITITVVAFPAATLSASKTTICNGDLVTFTAGATGTNYAFKINGSAIVSGSSNTYSTTSLNNGDVVTVDVSNGNGCTATSPGITITSNGSPTGTLSASATTICAGDNITFTATSGFSLYEFKVNGVTAQGPAASNTFSSTTITNGQVVTVVVSNSSSCTTTFNPILINVNALPSGTLSATENSGTPNDNSICPNAVVNFTATSGFSNYNFKVNGVSKQNSASNTFSSTTLANNDSVSVDVTSSTNCISTFNKIKITVVAAPTGSVSFLPLSVCAGDFVSFNATAGYNNYVYKVNGVVVQSSSVRSYGTATLTTGDVVTVDVTNTNGCTTTFNPITMTVNPVPSGTLVPVENSGNTANDGIICAGATVIFTAPSGYTNYNFFLNGTSAQNGSATTYSNSTLANGDKVIVVISNSNNCKGTLNQITITVNALPASAAITGNLNVCVNSTTALADATAGGVWSSLTTSIATVDASGVVTGVSAGTATINYTVTNSNGCATVKSASVTVNALPVVAAIGGNFNVCIGSTSQLTESTSGGTWSSSNTSAATISAAGLVSGVASGTSTISYTVTNSNSCTTVVTALITVNTLPTVAPITVNAPATTFDVCVNSTITLADATSGGVWTSGNTSIATVNSSGVVTGVANGAAVISYTVTNGSSCSTTVTQSVNVHALPVVTLTGANPLCPNATEVYTTQAGQSNYNWAFTGGTLVAGGTSTDNTITIKWNLTGSRTINVNYTNSFGCSGTTSATLTTAAGTIPTLSGPAAVCLNDNGSYVTQSGQTNYIWAVNGGSITAGGTATTNTATVNWSTAGAESVSVNFTDINGCTASSPTVYPVTVNTLPTATVTGTTNACIGGTSPSITFTGAAGVAPYTFTYNINGGSTQTVVTSSGNSVTVAVPTTILGSYTYNLISVAGNNSCTQPQTGAATVTVTPLPTGNISGTTTVCQNSTAPAVTFTGVIGTAPFTFTYNINGGANQLVTTVSGSTVTVAASTAAAGTFVYNLVSVADANSCSQAQSGSATIKVNASPTATVSGTTSVCIGGTAPVVIFTGAGGTAPYKFTYNINGGSNIVLVATGTTATVTAPTGTAGSFAYNLVSVQDASTTLCSAAQTGTATVTVTPLSIGGAVSADAPACYGTNSGTLTLSGNNGTVIRWEFSKDGGSTWTTIVNTTSSYTYANITQTTRYRAVVQSGPCSSANSTPAIITVNAVTAPGTVGTSTSVCNGSNSGTLTLTGNNGTVVRWESSVNAGSTWSTISNTTTTQTYSNITQTTLYRAVVQNGVCATSNSVAATITVKALPTATVSGNATVCVNASAPLITFTGASGTAPYTFTYNINGGSAQTIATAAGNSSVTVSAPTTASGVYNYNLTNVTEGSATTCTQAQTGTATVTVNGLPAAPTISPASATLCQGAVQPLTAGTSPSSGSPVFSSGAISLSIPDNNSIGVTSSITTSGIPAGAVITGVVVNFNITHTYDQDLVINLKAPNNNVLNLVNKKGGSGDNYTNTSVSSAGSAAFTTSSSAPPFTGTFKADAVNAVVGASSGGGNTSNVTAFSSLYGTPNGNWVFSARDVSNNDTGSIKSWSITINYTLASSPQSVVWSPATDLYTDAGATTAYTGTSVSTVYAKPSTAGSIIYTATASNASSCTNSSSVTLTVNPVPVVSITADYCAVPGKVHLTAVGTSGVTYLWSTGATTQSIDVDISNDYQVTASLPTGCSATASIAVAQELVTNGDFTNGNTGFTSDYTYYPDVAGNSELINDTGTNGYGVGTNGQNYHPAFWGQDHTNNTSGPRNFMLVNGHGTLVIWKETITVVPNTTYYYSAWGIGLNSGTPVARLQFNVNGAQVGTIDTLPVGVNSNSNSNWTRFYGNWTSGPTTTSVNISITDLETSAGSNDFGIDDVSFGTLSTFVSLASAPGTDAQVLCTNTPLTNIVYNVGNGTASGPTVAGLPAGVTSSFAGSQLTISGSPTVAGNYTYTITTTGTCNPTSASGTITAQAPSITLNTGTSSPIACINNPISISFTIGGTATGATVTGLPAGVTGALSGTTYTLSGTPTVAGAYPYTITTTGGTCTAVTANGTITLQSQSITLNSAPSTTSQSPCINTAITNIQYTVAGTATGATVSGLPAGVTGSYNSGFVIISGTPTAAGTFNYTVTSSGTCNAVTSTGSITVLPAAIGGTLPSVSACSTTTGTLTLTGQTGSIVRWESSTNNGTSWTTIANTTTSQAYTATGTPTLYRVVVSTSCNTAFSTVATVGVHNIWAGVISPDWNTGANWGDGLVPSISCPNVTIPAGTPNNPILGSGTATINNLDIKSGATLTVTGATLQIGGTLTSNGTFNVNTGTIEFNGTSVQNIAGSNFSGNTMLNLTVSNSSGLTVAGTAGVPLNITGVLSFGNVNNSTLTTGNNIVLISTATGTAMVADITNNGINSGNKFSGNVAVERYFPARRAWRLVTSPLSGAGTVFSTWQNNGVFTAGRGTYVSGPGAGPSNGMDVSPQSNTSLKVGSALTPVTNTLTTNLSTNTGNADNKGYFLFVRGDRTYSNFNIYNSNTTTISSIGKLQTGAQSFVATPTAGAYTLIGNPYASPVDFSKLNRTNLANRFYAWDPYLNNQQGAYVMLDDIGNTGTYTSSPSSPPSGQTKILQSSQAFFVQTVTSAPASVSFAEPAKSTSNNLSIFRVRSGPIPAFSTNLYLLDQDSVTMADGNLTQFDESFNKEVDMQDAVKFGNVYETLGLLNGATSLAADRRPPLAANDTIFYKLLRPRQRNYQFEFVPSNLNPKLMPLLQDSYTNIPTQLSIDKTSKVNFTVDANAASQSPTRFRVIFIAPLAYTNVTAAPDNSRHIAVQWNVANEWRVKSYELEKSTDSISFIKMDTAVAKLTKDGTATYNWLDGAALTGDNFYRIKNLNMDGTSGYSKVVNLNIPKGAATIGVYPNPVTDGIIGLQLSYLPQGIYHVRLMNSLGQVVLSREVSHPGGSGLQTLDTHGKLTGGIYKLEVTNPDKTQTTINVLVQ